MVVRGATLLTRADGEIGRRAWLRTTFRKELEVRVLFRPLAHTEPHACHAVIAVPGGRVLFRQPIDITYSNVKF